MADPIPSFRVACSGVTDCAVNDFSPSTQRAPGEKDPQVLGFDGSAWPTRTARVSWREPPAPIAVTFVPTLLVLTDILRFKWLM